MGSWQSLIVIDTNIFVIDLRYPRDKNFGINKEFLNKISRSGLGVTTLVNLLEVCGILSFNLNPQQLTELFFYFSQYYRVQVIPPPEFKQPFPALQIEDIFKTITLRTSLGDALFITTIKKYLPIANTIVSWDKEHLAGKINIEVISPEDFLNKQNRENTIRK